MNNPKGQQLFLKPDEAKFISMAVVSMLEDVRKASKDLTLNWNPQSRKEIKEMVNAGESLRIKMKKLGFDMRDLPPYIDGEETEFLTKQS